MALARLSGSRRRGRAVARTAVGAASAASFSNAPGAKAGCVSLRQVSLHKPLLSGKISHTFTYTFVFPCYWIGLSLYQIPHRCSVKRPVGQERVSTGRTRG